MERLEKEKITKIRIRILEYSEMAERSSHTLFCNANFGQSVKKRLPLLKFSLLALIVAFVWFSFSSDLNTVAYFNDTETSHIVFSAGKLDFYLSSPSDFSPQALLQGETAVRTISFLNTDNIPKYKVKAANFSGGLCEYLDLKASLDGVDVGYIGKLADFDYGPVNFEAPDDWTFSLTLPPDAPESIQGQTCDFNFIFYGSQTRNNLPFGQGFSDTEEEISNVASKICFDSETRTMGYWKNHQSIFEPHLPQYLGNEEISTAEAVEQVFKDYNLSMRNKLKGQLLAMKFNAAHFGVGDYLVPSENKTINQIIAEADDLLKQEIEPSDEILGVMKNLLDALNQDMQMKTCSLTAPAFKEQEPFSSVYILNPRKVIPAETGSSDKNKTLEENQQATSTKETLPPEPPAVLGATDAATTTATTTVENTPEESTQETEAQPDPSSVPQ